MIGIWIIIFVSLVALAFIYGMSGYDSIDVIFEFKSLGNPFYHVGVSFNEYPNEEYVEQEFIIGLFFINFIVVFTKDKSDA